MIIRSGYDTDDLSRPISRNADTFGYNERGEVTDAVINGNVETGAYDLSYDSASRLVSLSSNGVLLVTNAYDYRGRRVRKTTSVATYTFLYDDWNLVRETVSYVTGETDIFEYFWGRDLSGSLQGAGGVGGLLYLKRNGTIYIPFTDANGNITAYVDSIGAVVAEYVYDCFGRTISQSGPLADVFHHRFSSKYFDVETELYYYGYRFYSPDLHRWVSRDPSCEEGGNNLYCFCGNDSVSHRDKNGCAYFAYRPLNVPLVGKSLGIRGITPYNADRPSNALRFFMSTRSRRNWVCPGSSRGSMPGDTRPRAGMTRVHR